MIKLFFIVTLIAIIGFFYLYLDPETCWSNIKSFKDFIDLVKLRTKQHLCKHEWQEGILGKYCTRCYHTKSYRKGE